MAAPCFTPRTVAFLRAIKRHNDRDWFRERKDRYETDVRAPMVALVERLAQDFRAFAPELVASPRTSIYRPYRDTRFSGDKAPIKTNVAAVFPWRGLGKHEGAGLYVEVNADYVWMGGGMYAPQTAQLQLVREHIAASFRRLRAIVEAPGFKKVVGALEGDRLVRVPRGFPADHPAGEYLKYRQFLAGREFPSVFASSPQLYPTALKVFRQVALLARFLNEPLA
jgi:uncharacterized protein (TIGR02453 family)